MTIAVGDKVPNVKVKIAAAEGGGQDALSGELLGGKKVVLFAVPGAFTPGCSLKHLPGYVAKADELLAKGVERIACISVNDGFVMGAWGNDQHAHGKVTMIADGNGEFTRAMGLTFDGTGFLMGHRSQRYAAILEDGVIKHLAVDEGGKIEVSAVDAILAALG